MQKNLSGLKRSTRSCVWFCSVWLADGSVSFTFLRTSSSTSTSSFLVFTSSSPSCWVSQRLNWTTCILKGIVSGWWAFSLLISVQSILGSVVGETLLGTLPQPWARQASYYILPIASQLQEDLMELDVHWDRLIFGCRFIVEWSQAVVDPCVALVTRMARGPLCRRSRKDVWHMVSNCDQNTKWFKPRFWPGRCLLYIFPSFFLLPSWLPGQFTTWWSFLRMPGFVQQPRLPLGGRGNRW